MRFTPSDPDIQTLATRMREGLIDLQPDFQRGEVWSTQKKQRLIDSILRRWHVPPIHLVETDDGQSQVLDGQQRLTAIRDFMNGRFHVDGQLAPIDPNIQRLDRLRYAQLPDRERNLFNKFTIRIFELTDYKPEEPYELFFRLNQPTNLTEAEKRNAFMGPARSQIKSLVEQAQQFGMTPQLVGFSNARMSYDDVISRFVVALEEDSLAYKISSTRVTERYRSKTPISSDVINVASDALRVLLEALALKTEVLKSPRMNKATLHTWLGVTAKWMTLQENLSPQQLSEVLIEFDAARSADSGSEMGLVALAVYEDRATSRVADVSSVILRDLIVWMFLSSSLPSCPHPLSGVLRHAYRAVTRPTEAEHHLLDFAQEKNWGGVPWL